MRIGLAQSKTYALQLLFLYVRLLLHAAICDDSLGMGERAMTMHGPRCRVPASRTLDDLT